MSCKEDRDKDLKGELKNSGENVIEEIEGGVMRAERKTKVIRATQNSLMIPIPGEPESTAVGLDPKTREGTTRWVPPSAEVKTWSSKKSETADESEDDTKHSTITETADVLIDPTPDRPSDSKPDNEDEKDAK
jgi:hypothetical protein